MLMLILYFFLDSKKQANGKMLGSQQDLLFQAKFAHIIFIVASKKPCSCEEICFDISREVLRMT